MIAPPLSSPLGVIDTVSPTSYYGFWLALGLIGIVGFLLLWQWKDRRNREDNLSEADRGHFWYQDVRRWVVAGTMTLLAVGIYYGSRLPYRLKGRPNLVFLETWLAVFALILILIGLAFLDWLATRNYARRHRNEIVREGMEILRDEIRFRAAHFHQGGEQNGFSHRDP